MPAIRDIPVGSTFGLWTVTGFAYVRRQAYWNVTCVCGTQAEVPGGHLQRGRSKGCATCRNTSHNMSGTPTYVTWAGLVQRTTNLKNRAWKDYGGRGITLAKRWRKFENFLADMGERPPGTELDREKNHLGYCKTNCRWVSKKVNHRNRRDNCLVICEGKKMTLVEASELSGIPYKVLSQRVRCSTNLNIFRPVGVYKRNTTGETK